MLKLLSVAKRTDGTRYRIKDTTTPTHDEKPLVVQVYWYKRIERHYCATCNSHICGHVRYIENIKAR